MATTTPNFGWAVPTSSDLVKNGAAAIETLGDSIDASLVDLKGGTTGQVLAKASGTDMDFTWTTSSSGMTNPMTTTGDTIYSSSGSTPARLGIGSSGQVLTVSGGVPAWTTPSAGGGMTLLSTTSMAGSSTTTVSSISQSYKKLVVYVRDFYPSGSTAQMSLRLNGFSSSSSYYGVQYGVRSSTSMGFQTMSNNSGFDLTAGFSNYLYAGNTDNFLVITIEDYANSTTKKPVSWQINAPNDSATVVNAFGIGHAVPVNDSAITSIALNTSDGTWTNGSILIYGVS